MNRLFTVIVMLSMVGQLHAADLEAGKVKAIACAACHGRNGVSVSGDIPNLAAQKAQYITVQLKAFRAGTRKNEFMNVMAGQLNDADIENLAAYFSSLPGATATAKADELAEVNTTRISFPADYKQGFTHYTTINFPERKQVRTYLANAVALQAARKGEPLPDGSVLLVEIFSAKLDAENKPLVGADGFFVPDKLTGFTAMERQKGWGEGFPEMIRNDDWQYAVFTAEKTLRATSQAKCLVCHKPHAANSYLFTLKQLTDKARAQ
jgi:cytochrome c553